MTDYAVTATKRKAGRKTVIRKDLCYVYAVSDANNTVNGELCINKALTALASNDTVTVTVVDGT